MNRNVQRKIIFWRNKLGLALPPKVAPHILSYQKVRQIGLLFRAENMTEAKELDALVKGLTADGKTVTAFTFLEDEPIPHCGFPFKAFRPTDFNWYGKPMVESLNRFLETELDYLIILSANYRLEIEYAARLSRAYCRLGNTEVLPQELLDITFSAGEGKRGIPSGEPLYKYIAQLQGHWEKPSLSHASRKP